MSINMKKDVIKLSADLIQKQDFSKKALMCRTGTFDGMNGTVTVTRKMLEGIAETYNLERKAPQNENDYRPVLTDHVREVDRVKGRIMPDLEVKPWTDPGTGEDEFGLFGTLRIDNEDAREKVLNGTYANLSISFDEDTFELFEISFVSIEAAKRSIILSNKNSTGGNKMAMNTKLMSLSKKHNALAAQVKQSRAKRQNALSQMIVKKTEVEKEITQLMKKTGEIALSIKASQLKAQFQEFVRQGKMNPIELKEIDFKELSSLSESARKLILSSYEKRAVSTDVNTFGQSSDKKISLDLSPAATRERMELQRSGKGASLAEEIPKENEEKKDLAEDDKEEKKSFVMSEDEHSKHMQDMMDCHEKLGECVDKIKSMGLDAEKISDEDKSDEKKESKEMSDESESEDMGAEDEETEKSKSKEKGE